MLFQPVGPSCFVASFFRSVHCCGIPLPCCIQPSLWCWQCARGPGAACFPCVTPAPTSFSRAPGLIRSSLLPVPTQACCRPFTRHVSSRSSSAAACSLCACSVSYSLIHLVILETASLSNASALLLLWLVNASFKQEVFVLFFFFSIPPRFQHLVGPAIFCAYSILNMMFSACTNSP